ncbi:MAG: hypothetical protein DRI90_22050 [Deltaproteobacteria bacterium]|nr:MAG: hypothetical protein DRI90_22050 [Deltaproteobacteria bacterium]
MLIPLIGVLALGCDDESEGEDDSASSSASASASAAASDESGKASKSSEASTGIIVKIADFQLFHPYSEDRAIQSVRDDGSVSTRSSTSSYGFGMVVEATNNTGQLLQGAWFEGELRFVGPKQTIRCKLKADSLAGRGFLARKTTFLSYDPPLDDAKPSLTGKPKSPWTSEVDSLSEASWRPGERIRMMARERYCVPITVNDMGITTIEGEITVKALPKFADRFERQFDGDDYDLYLVGNTVRITNPKSSRIRSVAAHRDLVKNRDRGVYAIEMAGAPAEGKNAGQPVKLSYVALNRAIDTWGKAGLVQSAPKKVALNPAALTMQLVKSDGDFVPASANVAIVVKEGKVKHVDLARLGINMLDMERKDPPATAPAVAFSANELSGKASEIVLTHFTDDTALSKGRRKLSLTWKLNLKGGDIEGRLRADLDKASAALDAAEKAADSASEDDEAKAKTAVTQAKMAKAAAERKYKTDRTRERTRLAKLFPCGDLKLVTNRKVRGAANKKEAKESCKALLEEDEVTVKIHFEIGRYELPAAVSFKLGTDTKFLPIVSAELIKSDPR